ncbi:P-loop containing nucleoside triphosphate hydrolase protein [Corynespora cassiicola Philippines]|uniref:P-loop containing nucleoside triphosphate hydrolase protein n=1 Tax=Corynespora cassiicola Philippines TaxID=1448308 RepID=A0A2T2NVQ0_CORCC|nr:P-loop containing nucleoside triphosphate hydrolase protein [Corynespora cassiicola Philippines]
MAAPVGQVLIRAGSMGRIPIGRTFQYHITSLAKMATLSSQAEIATSEKLNSDSAVLKDRGTPEGDCKAKRKERVQRVDQLYSKKNREKYFKPTPRSKDVEENIGSASSVVLKVRRIICDKGFPTSTEIDIKSKHVKSALDYIFKGVEGLSLNESPPVATPELLFHARSELENLVAREERMSFPNIARIDDIKTALQYITEDHGPTIKNVASLLLHNEIKFDLLWTLFAPNAVVYTKSNLLQEDQAMKLETSSYKTHEDGSQFLELKLRYIWHDGTKLGWAITNKVINHFAGAIKITHLDLFPMKFHPNHKKLQVQLRDRGTKFVGLVKGSYMQYSGAAIAENREVCVGGEYKKALTYISGRVMFDPITLVQQNSGTDLLKPDVEAEIEPTLLRDEDLIFCNHYVGGFSFRHKKWVCLAISRHDEVQWDPRAFEQLVIDPRKRDLIHSLVKSHKNTAGTFDDIIAGKGLGLVGLLSGTPGVGKTLTAEAISEVTKRPLYMLSAGELGTSASSVEYQLDMVLEIAKTWSCVLLIDEADVFLEQRTNTDLGRNAIVSVFLRRLEYFQGVLIMTTNRQDTIDEAFKSRIHFKLHYNELTTASRAAIWRNCFDSMPSTVPTVGISNAAIDDLANLTLNGRQIKNVVSCAVSIAIEEKKSLTTEDIKMILNMVVDDGNDQRNIGFSP